MMVKKILIVDDDQEDLNTIKLILENEGFEVILASNGAEALEQLQTDGFNLAIIDIKMPTLSGYDLLRLLRERVNHKIKIIYASIVPEKEVDMDGIDGFIQKPFLPETLLEIVKEAL